jgi:hypothetical protein
MSNTCEMLSNICQGHRVSEDCACPSSTQAGNAATPLVNDLGGHLRGTCSILYSPSLSHFVYSPALQRFQVNPDRH